MNDLERYSAHSKKVFSKDNIQMLGMHYGAGLYKVIAFVDGNLKYVVSYKGNYDAKYVSIICSELI